MRHRLKALGRAGLAHLGLLATARGVVRLAGVRWSSARKQRAYSRNLAETLLKVQIVPGARTAEGVIARCRGLGCT